MFENLFGSLNESHAIKCNRLFKLLMNINGPQLSLTNYEYTTNEYKCVLVFHASPATDICSRHLNKTHRMKPLKLTVNSNNNKNNNKWQQQFKPGHTRQ